MDKVVNAGDLFGNSRAVQGLGLHQLENPLDFRLNPVSQVLDPLGIFILFLVQTSQDT